MGAGAIVKNLLKSPLKLLKSGLKKGEKPGRFQIAFCSAMLNYVLFSYVKLSYVMFSIHSVSKIAMDTRPETLRYKENRLPFTCHLKYAIMIIAWRNQSKIRLISLPNDKLGSE